MSKVFTVEQVAQHASKKSCWVILYDKVYDVTDFLPEHPGGSKIILSLAGKDATDEYDPVHPAGTLEENLKPEALLGNIDLGSLREANKHVAKQILAVERPPPLKTLLNMDDVEAAATRIISKKCWAYYFSASDDMLTKSLNTAVYRTILLRPRVFVDSTSCDTSTTLLGHKVGTPLYVSPTAMGRLAHPEGEWGVAQGISRFGAAQIVSNHASMTPEQVVENAREGQILGWQLYVQNDRRRSEAMLARISKPAMRKYYKFIVLTLDAPWPGKRELDERVALEAQASVDNDDDAGAQIAGGLGQQNHAGTAADLTWQTTLPWLAQHTDLPIVLKGIQTHEDAFLASQHVGPRGNVQAIILSNHGGRGADTAPPPVHTLLEIRKYCPAVFDKVEVWVDGGIKRGTDVVKALCLGAKAVGIGRLPLWGLGVGGKEGVERVFAIFQDEIDRCMRLLGAQVVTDLGPQLVNARAVERDILDTEPGLLFSKQGPWAEAKL